MPNFFINDYQVNDDYFNVVITSTDVSHDLNLASHNIPKQARPVQYFTSGDAENYDISFTIYRTSGTWSQLTVKQRAIAEIVRNQLAAGGPLLLRVEELPGENPCPIYLGYNAVYVYVTSPTLKTVGTNGKSFLDIKLDGQVLGVPISAGGDIALTEFYGVVSN